MFRAVGAMLDSLAHALRMLTMIVVGTVGGLVALVALGIVGFVTYDNRTYASRLLSAHVDVDHVLASRNSRYVSSGRRYCAYAVVALAKDAPADPPPAWRDPRLDSAEAKPTAFGGTWVPTEPPGPYPRGPADWLNRANYLCRGPLGDVLADRMVSAFQTPGGWFAHVASGDIYVYSKPLGIAYRLRLEI